MNNFELIHDFVDGTISSADEEKLFAMLTTNDEMRLELKQQLAIKNAVKSDIKAFTPKAESTMKIFGALGFTAPIPVVQPSLLTRLKDFYFGNQSAIITGFASALVTALLFWTFGSFGDSKSNFASSSNSPEVVIFEPALVETYVPADDKYTVPAEKVIYKDRIIVKNENNSDAISDEMPVNLTYSNLPSYSSQNTIFQQSNNRELSPINNISNFPDVNFNNKQSEFLDRFFVEFSGTSYINGTKGEMQPSEQMLLANTNFALFYEINPQLYFGFSYTRENFYQKFNGYEYGQLFLYEQNPNLHTFNVNLRYVPEWLRWGFVSPFANFSVGGNTIGPVVRFGAGAKLDFGLRAYLYLGVDQNIMWYQHQNTLNNSSKIGIHGGVGIKF